MPDFVWRNHACCNQIVNLVQIDLLSSQFFPDGIKSLYPTFNTHERDTRFRHLCFDSFGHAGEERFILCTPLLELFGQLSIVFRVQMTECEIFQLAAELTHSQAVRDGRENLHGLFSNPFSLFRAEVLESTHIVKTVSQLDEDDSYVVHHGKQHLAYVFGLLLFARNITDLRYLGEPINEMRDFFSEVLADGIEVHQRVFHDIVKKSGSNRHLVELHIRENVRHFQRVNQVRLAGRTLLSLMLTGREEICATEQIEGCLWVITRHGLDNFFDANHLNR